MRASVIFRCVDWLSLWQIAGERRTADGFDVSRDRLVIVGFLILTRSRGAAERKEETRGPGHGAETYFTRFGGGREGESARIWKQK